MDLEMESVISDSDEQVRQSREQFRRYGKRQSSSSKNSAKSSESRPIFDGCNFQGLPNAALFLEDIKQEVDNFDVDASYVSKRRTSLDGQRSYELDGTIESARQARTPLKHFKHEDESWADSGETTFSLFASLIDSALHGLIPFPDLILQFENKCREVSELIKDGATGRHRIVEDKLMKRKAQILLDEAATWSLLWYLFGKGNDEIPGSLIMSPSTSHQEACNFVLMNHTAQLCLRIVQWLEDRASKVLDLEKRVRGWHVGSYLHHSGVWHRTQRLLKKGPTDTSIIQHLDFDAPTREQAHPVLEDKKQDEALLEDIWLLLRAGRVEEACDLCRSAGQPWRAATLCPFGGLDSFPSVEALVKPGKNRALQAVELEMVIGFQRRLWKWACFSAAEKIAEQDGGRYETAVFAVQCSNLKRLLPVCTDWESACWAMAKSWLDVQIDLELARYQPSRSDDMKSNEVILDGAAGEGDQTMQGSIGPESWPSQVLDQQPRDLHALLQKLHSGEMVHEAVSRGCREQHRQIEMDLMVGDVAHVLDLLRSWISPPEDDGNFFSPQCDPQMIRFGAHLVLVLRYLLADDIKDEFKDKLTLIGDLILHMYAVFLFSKNREELVGVYASQLAPYLCVELFVHMMELRLNESVHVKYKIFRSAMEYLSFFPGDASKGCVSDILERVLSRSREIKRKDEVQSNSVAEQHRLQSLQKAMVVQWLCFTPPFTINDFEAIKARLLMRALMHSIVLLREFALISMWRVPKLPVGAHMLLSFLAEPLKQQPIDTLLSIDEHDVSQNIVEFEDWKEYYSCDATYRKWLKADLENTDVPLLDLSLEEREKAIVAAKEALSAALALLQRKENPWLALSQNLLYASADHSFIELHTTAMFCLPSGDCMLPDATSCTTLTSALYSTVNEDVIRERRLMVNVSIPANDQTCIKVVINCLAVEGDGLGLHESNDGGLLAAVMAAGFKGELSRFETGVTLEISQLDAWYKDAEGTQKDLATYVVRGLCRRCCLPELILRIMQISVSLAESGITPDDHDELIELVASPESGLLHLFSQHQLQEFLLFEREYAICKIESQEETLTD
ncbi:nuclear pore complex protein NUP107 isoform X1 [Amborella trichopoda]|uniref:Nuclear pore complex protein n=2 Tax=Amborella trichopoda TaxID=13333 RepID=W1PCY8_AMBTC|nr:nuclear pore complex protein NUP107 isoform X1 [Amborella trichopoda]XP_020522508.1 nuclear pore complex protein NUP107 isoform X1 [Amborella trichopoda]XP_020522509.1 nuclear pore complex protein NUP107 isoform X1 [Amborella trichopoda]XP_020522510.1 nuclear pore complex protein NUP107 isoform X1 [Amborella trichopoda]ERN05569.1 hypothetical protein AMTR_s00007p00267150 [Amborella trichopoda]|eukprot:XP_006843894.1 nuclear pore complex protein NUP107 isoform X1 [Amborella trichopoda]